MSYRLQYLSHINETYHVFYIFALLDACYATRIGSAFTEVERLRQSNFDTKVKGARFAVQKRNICFEPKLILHKANFTKVRCA